MMQNTFSWKKGTFLGREHTKKCTSSRKMESCFPVRFPCSFSGKSELFPGERTLFVTAFSLVYDSLLSPTIMVLRRPRREEGGRGHGQQEGRGRALAGRGLPAVHVRGLLPRQGRPQNQMIEGAKKGIISLLSGQTCPASPASPSSWSKRTLSRKLLCYLN